MINWSYVAGFFDGEGCLTHNQGSWGATFTQTNKQVLEAIQEFLLQEGIPSKLYLCRDGRAGNYLGTKPAYRLHVQSKRSILTRFLTSILPYLYVKKTIVQDTLRYFKLFPDLRFYRYNLVHKTTQ